MDVVLEGTRIRSLRDFHVEIARLLDFGPYYGHNLDALWDRVSTDVPRPVRLTWVDAASSRRHLGPADFSRVVAVLERAAGRDRESGWVDRFEVEVRD